jgi:hypothetical protein
VRIFVTRWFARFARREGIADAELRDAVRGAERGLVDADLGGGVLKQRIARPGAGKRGGFRSIVIFRAGERAIFVYGFAKRSRATIRPTSCWASNGWPPRCWAMTTRPSPRR